MQGFGQGSSQGTRQSGLYFGWDQQSGEAKSVDGQQRQANVWFKPLPMLFY